MNISKNVTIFAGIESGNSTANKAEGKRGKIAEDKQLKKDSIFAGSLNGELFSDKILEKKKEAQKKAMQVVGDAWTGDQNIDDDLQKRRDLLNKLGKDNAAALREIREISRQQEALKEEYGISDDSKEQQDLELIRRYNRMLSNEMRGKLSGGDSLTKGELDYVMKLKAEGLTDYQTKQLQLDEAKSIYQSSVDKNNQTIIEENAVIRGIRLERLKSDPMVSAKHEAKAIREAAADEIVGMVVEQAKEYLDEKKEEADKKGERQEEKQEQLEEFIEAQKEKRKETDEVFEDMPVEEMLDLAQVKNDIKQEVEKIVDKMALVAEDIKGA
ncbi:MAG: hypothetical protein ACI4DN_06345, partial [Lachnospiraceae bacterium]